MLMRYVLISSGALLDFHSTSIICIIKRVILISYMQCKCTNKLTEFACLLSAQCTYNTKWRRILCVLIARLTIKRLSFDAVVPQNRQITLIAFVYKSLFLTLPFHVGCNTLVSPILLNVTAALRAANYSIVLSTTNSF